MKHAFVFGALLLLSAVATATLEEDVAKWIAFKERFGRRFAGAAAESERFGVFQASLRRAERLNALNTGAHFGVTRFSDLTQEEFRRRFTGLNISGVSVEAAAEENEEEKPSLALGTTDWSTNSGRVTAVKNQGSCGSCWSFSTTGVLEGCYGKTHSTTYSLSEQNLLDCWPDNGRCNGEDPRAALRWAAGHGLNKRTIYPYTGSSTASCSEDASALIAKVSTANVVSAGTTETAIRTALASSPVAIAIDADPLQDYEDGVISDTLCTERTINHAVLLVGDKTNYKVKNSWSSSWGESGYFRMQIGKDCLGVTKYATKAC